MPNEKKELKIDNFIKQVLNKDILDDTIYDMFLDIQNEGDKEKIANALITLENERPEVATKAATIALKHIHQNQVD